MFRGGTFYKMLGLYLRFHASFIHGTLIGVMLNFWKVGVAPTTPLYTKTAPLVMLVRLLKNRISYSWKKIRHQSPGANEVSWQHCRSTAHISY